MENDTSTPLVTVKASDTVTRKALLKELREIMIKSHIIDPSKLSDLDRPLLAAINRIAGKHFPDHGLFCMCAASSASESEVMP